MPITLYAGGLGGTVDDLVVNKPFYQLDGLVLYVHFATGVDGIPPAGRDKQAPLKTLRQALTNAPPHTFIVLLDGHEEVVTAVMQVNVQGLVIVGCGQTAGVPNVKLQLNAPTGSLISALQPNCQLRNLKILSNAQHNTTPRIDAAAVGFVMSHCYVECGPNDGGSAVGLKNSARYAGIRDTTIISTATSAAARPASGLKLENAAGVEGLTLDGLVIDDGAFGFASGYGLDLGTGPGIELRGNRVSLLRGASAKLGANATGYLIPVVTGGGAIDV